MDSAPSPPAEIATPTASRAEDLFSEVRPGGVWGRALEAIENPRKHRWNAYLRACKRIPKTSPVAGSTSFERINQRRHDLIDKYGRRGRWKALKADVEYQAVSRATSEWLCGPTVASNFLLGRLLRRLRAMSPENGSAVSPGGGKE